MDILEKTLSMLEKYPLCDHCLGRQFALLGYNIENMARGRALKLSLTLQSSALSSSKNAEGMKRLKILATNGFSREAQETLQHLKKRIPKKDQSKTCFLCEDKFQLLDDLMQKALIQLADYEYTTFLVGVEVPVAVEEREDEFKAAFDVGYGESVRHEFGRLFGKGIAEKTGKDAEYKKPDIVVIIDPFAGRVRLQVNPLFVAGRYRKLVRDIPQSKWFCSSCHGKGCEECGGTGKMYPESVEELSSAPILTAAEGEKTSFHASGREDIDARMLPHQDYPEMLLDGKIHAFNRLGAIPAAVVDEIGVQKKIALVDFSTELDRTGFLKKYPYYQKVFIKGLTYKGEDRDVVQFGSAGFLIVHKDVPESIIYEFTKLAYSPEAAKSVDMAFKGQNLNRKDPFEGNIGPIHPGAAKFWKEVGIQIPESILK